jgi:hypothetical protein
METVIVSKFNFGFGQVGLTAGGSNTSTCIRLCVLLLYHISKYIGTSVKKSILEHISWAPATFFYFGIIVVKIILTIG